jgi:2-polyprenyl-3-methyl-5-hydroxy-6-metoxy-1,4-benzoquinol methylase
MNSEKAIYTQHNQEIDAGARFSFGENWSNYLKSLDEEKIRQAEISIKTMLGIESLMSKKVIDIGCGSGLFSLAARRLGADVYSFDYDPKSVACANDLKRLFFSGDRQWTIEEGSVLDNHYLDKLGKFDVVYSWGVLHHTGHMWSAIDNATALCNQDGYLFIAIYNFMGGASKRWTWIKKIYCKLPTPLKLPFAIAIMTPILLRSFFIYLLQGKVVTFFSEKFNYKTRRGMNWWHDQIDWIGGYPYEDARPEEVFAFVQKRGFSMERFTTCGGGIGCNQFVFRKN